MRKLVEKYIFSQEKNRAKIYNEVKKKALKREIFLASIAPFYKQIANGDVAGLSVPAFNIRTLTFDTACSIFKVAKKNKTSAFVIEVASSEMEYTRQTPEEFALCVLGAAIKEKYKGPIFLQGDHFYLKDTSQETINNLQNLILQCQKAGFYNFDIDCSALALEDNIKYTNYFIEFIKKNQPQGIEVAIGGEVSSIGGSASLTTGGDTKPGQLEEFLKRVHGLTKVSCQTGTRHGGNVLPSGLIKNINIDFVNIKRLSEVAKHYGLAGIVQHGASTLQESQFAELVKANVLEVHLSTLFSDIVFDSRYFPKALKEKMYSWVEQNFTEQKKNFDSDRQFIKVFRKKALGIFKKEIWQMLDKNIKGIRRELEEKFLFFFKIFGVYNTKDLIKKIYN